MAEESPQSFDKIRKKFNVPEKPLIPQSVDSPPLKPGHRHIDWLTKDGQVSMHHGDDKLACGQAVERPIHPKSPIQRSRQSGDVTREKPESGSYTDEAASLSHKDKILHMEQEIAARSRQQAERPRPLGKQAGPSGRTVSMTAANAGPKPPPPEALPRRAISLTAANESTEEPPQPSDRDSALSSTFSLGSMPPMIAEEGDSETGFGSSSTAGDHRPRMNHSQGSGVGASRFSTDSADMEDVATLRRLLSERDTLLSSKEVELQSERMRVKQYEAASAKRASSSSSSSTSSGRSSAQLQEGRPVVIQVKEWGDKEAQELRTAVHVLTGAYKAALEKIKLLEDALEQREAIDAAAENRNRQRIPVASERV